MSTVLVTGGTGFIGQALLRELLSHHDEILCLTHRNPSAYSICSQLNDITFIQCDLNENIHLSRFLPDVDIDAIYHLGWSGVSGKKAMDPYTQMNNMRFSLELLKYGISHNVSVFIGAGSFHEAEAQIEMASNKVIANLGYMYKAAKLATHWMLKSLAGHSNVRFFWPLISTYGEGENSKRLINSIIRSIYSGKTPKLTSGEQLYDYVHVSDVARALYLISKFGVDGSNYVISSGNPQPLRNFLNIVGDIANELNNSHVSLGFGLSDSSAINLPRSFFETNLTRDTGFCPKVSFSEGIRRTALWIKQQEKY